MYDVKKIVLFLFSGTGMTKYIIDKMKPEFEKQQAQFDVFSIESVQLQNISLGHYDAIGVAYPVHSFNAPKIVIDFTRRLPKTESQDAFIISSAGELSPLNNASSDLLIKIFTKKGYNVFYDIQFEMPCNFLIKDDEGKVLDKLSRANADIPSVVSKILDSVKGLRHSSFGVKILAFFGRAEWYGVKYFKLLYTNKKCNNCGICVSSCPNRNIEHGATKAVFKRNCGLCMRCIYLCPNQAIKAYWLYKSISFDSWYDFDELSILD